MRYMLLCYEPKLDAGFAVRGGQEAYIEELTANKFLVLAETLESVESAVTIRVRSGHLSVRNEPVNAADHRLDRFLLVDARDLNDAIRIASKSPSARAGTVEIRPVRGRSGRGRTSQPERG